MKSECRNAISNQVDLQRTALRMHLMLQRTDSVLIPFKILKM